MYNTKQEILNYLIDETKNIRDNDFSALTTSAIADALSISRSVASQYLNELFKTDCLVKINSRPVYFFHKNEMEKIYELHELKKEYLNIDELLKYISINSYSNKDFAKAIGYDGSLNYCLSQIKSALIYPGNGLPIIIYGQKGSGKSYLVDLMKEFCINHEILSKDIQIVRYKVLKNMNSTAILFGEEGKTNGLFEEAKDSILYIENGNLLDDESQEKLAEYIATQSYRKIGGKKLYRYKIRLVLGTTENPTECMNTSLLQRVPIIVKVPNLNERGDDEKEQFVLKFFRKQSERMQRKIRVSLRLFDTLSHLRFDYHINELEKCITTICASALNDANNETVDCYLYHLPDGQFDLINTEDHSQNESEMIDIENFEGKVSYDKLLQLFDMLLDEYAKIQKGEINFKDFVDHGYTYMRSYYEFMVFQQHNDDAKIMAMEKLITSIFVTKKMKNQINLPSNCGFTLARTVVVMRRGGSKLNNWINKNKEMIDNCILTLKQEMYNEYVISMNISKQIEQLLDIQLSNIEIIFLMLNIHFYNDDLSRKDIVGIVISHGYSTASSIADAANNLLNMHIFEAFDMPLDTSASEIVKKVNDFIRLNPFYRDLILMVDMGSLESIGESISSDMNVGIINNISTGIALHIGMMIKQKVELEEILKSACEESQSRYRILAQARKEEVVVFTNDAGLKVSERMSNLFRNSLPKNIDLKFMEYSYDDLVANGEKDPLFQKYEVTLMVKPYNLILKNINSVTLEDIVSYKDIKAVDEALVKYLNEEEIEIFNNNLLKNFSLQNVMENLTILNANKLLDYVSDSLMTLQKEMKRKFQSKTIVGIYMHVCFLIERLVTKNAIYSYEDVESFEKKEKRFIEEINRSFKPMLDHYNVEIPISEIALLHDYIESDLKWSEENDF